MLSLSFIFYLLYYICQISGAARISVPGGDILGCRPRRGFGEHSPPDARKFWKFPKNFSRKLQKMDYLRRFFKKIKNCVKFRALEEKPNCVGNSWKKFQRLLWKKQKNTLFWSIFTKNQNPAWNLRAFWRKP